MSDEEADVGASTVKDSASRIAIFARVRPTPRPSPFFRHLDNENRLEFAFPKDAKQGLINNTRDFYDFRFNKVFGADDKQRGNRTVGGGDAEPLCQDGVFERVAKPAVQSVLDGYNATIFAYGQTGSGKTFTITGGPELYADRGIIPRSLQMIFAAFQQQDKEFTCQISYFEIYNEKGYDLLSATSDVADLDRLREISIREGDDGNYRIHNCREVEVRTEEEAINLLFEGDMNRMIASTPMNQASSRSHCIFMVNLAVREPGSDLIRRSKLNLVDLAGSERVHKTGAAGTLLREAKYINLSLLFLEEVIVALQEKGRGKRFFIPYRNSMMTLLLKDSLGGNCRTAMVATLSMEPQHLNESISTCQFAQRVAMIQQSAVVNEELDPQLVIKRLKAEVTRLKDELALATGGVIDEPLVDSEREKVVQLVKQYIEEKDGTLFFADSRKIEAAFAAFKEMYLKERESRSGQIVLARPPTAGERESSDDVGVDARLVKLRGQIQQRDAEIKVLVSMLNKKKQRAEVATQTLAFTLVPHPSHSLPLAPTSPVPPLPPPTTVTIPPAKAEERKERRQMQPQLPNKDQAFMEFKKTYRGTSAANQNKELLRQKYAEAKKYGEAVQQTRATINKYKALIEQLRVERALQGGDITVQDQEEEKTKALIEKEKASYKSTFMHLRELRAEIEHIQRLLEQGKARLKNDFEHYYASLCERVQSQAAPAQPSDKDGMVLSGMVITICYSTDENTEECVRPVSESAVPLTGDAAADADIAAFYKAKDGYMQRVSSATSSSPTHEHSETDGPRKVVFRPGSAPISPHGPPRGGW